MPVLMNKCFRISLLLACLGGLSTVYAQDVIPARLMSLELARDIAQGTLDACHKDGYQVAVS